VVSPTGPERTDESDGSPWIVRSEEELELGVETRELGRVRARKAIDTETVEEVADRRIEEALVERARGEDGDAGEVITLPDGSVSIPVFEEQLVVSKRLVVRERVILRKYTTTEHHRIEAELRRERIEVSGDEGTEVEDRRI
jgi:uncharacterized protein (TIGR02271 family)